MSEFQKRKIASYLSDFPGTGYFRYWSGKPDLTFHMKVQFYIKDFHLKCGLFSKCNLNYKDWIHKNDKEELVS